MPAKKHFNPNHPLQERTVWVNIKVFRLESPMPVAKFLLHVLDAHAHLFHQHEEVVHEVAGFILEAVLLAAHGFDDGFDRLLANLLCYFLHALDEKAGGVGVVGHLLMPFLNDVREPSHEALALGSVEAGSGAPVASGAGGVGGDEQRVAVAVFVCVDHGEEVAARLAFRPERLAGAAEEGHFPRRHGFLESFLVHISEHQHPQCRCVLNDDGKQRVGAL